jgi:hypothetical protein
MEDKVVKVANKVQGQDAVHALQNPGMETGVQMALLAALLMLSKGRVILFMIQILKCLLLM